MRFDEFEQRLNELLDERKGWDADPEVARLIRESTEHRAVAAAYSEAIDPRTIEALDPLPPCAPPGDLTSRVMAALRTAPRVELAIPASTRVLTGRSMPAALALAAAVLLAVGLYVLRGSSSSDRPPIAEVAPSGIPAIDRETAVAKAPDDAPAEPASGLAAAPTDDASIGELAQEARDKYADLARDTQRAMSEVAMLLPGFGAPSRGKAATNSAAEASSETAVEGDPERPDDWAGHVGDGLEPLTRSAMGALDFILNVLPAENVPPKS